MKKFKIFAFLSLLSVVGSVFAAEWSFANSTGTKTSDPALITASIADAETIDISNLGTWTTTANTLKLEFTNPDEDKSGYKVTGTVSGSIEFLFTVDSVSYSKETVNVIDVSAQMEEYVVEAGNVKATVTFDASKCTSTKNATEGTISLVVPSTAFTAGECTGEFTKEADYTAFKTAIQSNQLKITAIAKSAE